MADQELHRSGSGVPVRGGRRSAGRRRARESALLRRAGAEFTHRDGLCSFEVLVEDYGIDDPAVKRLARIVHGADIPEDRDVTPQSRGLLAVAEGFHLLELGDHRQLELSLPVYDALYAWCKAEVGAVANDMSLVRTGFVPIPRGAKPGFDHADVHVASSLMYVAHTGANRVDVLDCKTQTHRRSLDDLPGVAGVLVDAEHDLLFTTDRGASRVSVFRCSDEELLGQVGVGPHPNGLAYDRRRRRLYAFNLGEPLGEGCTVSVVDLGQMRVSAELELRGRPRWALYDPERDRIYANIREPAEIAVIDAERIRGRRGISRSERRAPWALARSWPALLRRRRWSPGGARGDERCRARDSSASWRSRCGDARLGAATSTRGDRRPRRHQHLRHRAPHRDRHNGDRARCAHDLLGARFSPPVRLLPRELGGIGLRGR